MNILEQIGLKLLRQTDPERAHGLALKALRYGVVPMPGRVTSSRLETELAGLKLPNPVGLAAGFDKNAEVLKPLVQAGFGFVEVGAVTPRPQPGNPKPRLFRLTEDKAAINRFGFNNEGMDAAAHRLAKRPQNAVIGLNLGANKDSDNRAKDFATVLTTCGPHLDFATVNVSSPNTEKLRELQGAEALAALLKGVLDANAALDKPIPIFLKIAPDLTDTEITEIAEVALNANLSAIITTNTTLSRDGLRSPHAHEAGGLSGAPLMERSTRVLAKLSKATGGKLPLIGVGGISSAEDAYTKIKAGASAVQLYTSLVFHGLSLATEISRGLDKLLEQDGHTTLQTAIATERDCWL